MSAVLVDEFAIVGVPELHLVSDSGRTVSGLVAGAAPTESAVVRRAASKRPTSGVRLTRRGLAVVMVGFVGTVLAGAITVVGAFLGVSDAPLTSAEIAAISSTH